MSEVLILRHGQTVWSLAQRYQAAMDAPLTPLGVQQAEAQGRILASHIVDPLDYQVLTSPQPRAARTAVLPLRNWVAWSSPRQGCAKSRSVSRRGFVARTSLEQVSLTMTVSGGWTTPPAGKGILRLPPVWLTCWPRSVARSFWSPMA